MPKEKTDWRARSIAEIERIVSKLTPSEIAAARHAYKTGSPPTLSAEECATLDDLLSDGRRTPLGKPPH